MSISRFYIDVQAALGIALCLVAVHQPVNPAPVPPPHYEGVITLGKPDQVSASLRISLKLPASSEYRLLLGRSFKIAHVEAEGATATVEDTERPFAGILQAIILRTAAGAARDVQVRVTYAGTLVQMQQPAINSVSPELVELSVDSWWLPYPSNLNGGLTADVEFRGIPEGATVVSTGEVTNEKNGVRVRLAAANDLALIAAPNLREVRAGKLLFYADDPASELAQTYLKHGVQALAELESLYGPIPEGGARIVIVPRPAPNGYNRRGYFVVSARGVKASEAALAISLAHEIAHCWWSKADFLGPDYWLVEGFAEYTGFRYGRRHFGETVMAPRFEQARARAAKAGPIVANGRASDAAVYSKSMLLLTELEGELGSAAMDRVLRRMANAATHTTAVFLDLLRDEAGPDVSNRFEQNLRSRD